MKYFPVSRKILIFLVGVLICVLIYFLYLRCLDIMSAVLWSILGVMLIAFNFWDVRAEGAALAEEQVKLARELMEKGQHLAASERLDKALFYDPGSFEAIVGRGELYRTEQQYAEAKRELLKAYEINPKSFRVHFALGLTYLQQKDVLGAISEFKQTIRLKPEFCESYYILASAYELSGDKAGALDSYRRFLDAVTGDDMSSGKISEYVERSKVRVRELS